MKHITQAAAAMLSLLIIVSTISCGTSMNTDIPSTVPSNEASTEQAATDTITSELPDADYDGYEFRILTKGTTNVHWKTRDIYAEEITGESINDAVYNRNIKIEDKYNIKIVEIGVSDNAAALKKSVLADDDAYDMASIGFDGSLCADDLLLNLYDMPYMDLEKPWYDQNANESLSISGKLFQTTGDMVVMDNDATWAVLFNKKIAQDLQLENFYDMVKNKTWTGAKMLEFAKLGKKDLNGDDKMHELDDQWGVIGSGFNSIALAAGAGERIADKDSEDLPFISLLTLKYLACFELSLDMHANDEFCLYAERYLSKYADPWTDCVEKAFVDGRALFNFSGINRVSLFRSMEVDFGILPVPKYDEAQQEYYSVVSLGSASSIAVPKTCRNAERTGIIIEALSEESYHTLTPAYYDITLKSKYARDEESSEMLDIIFANRVFDLGMLYNWGSMMTMVDSLTTKKSRDLTSSYEKSIDLAQKQLSETVERIMK